MQYYLNGGEREYYSFNVHGDTAALFDAAGTITKNYDYDAFGNQTTAQENDNNPFRYCGEYFDNETNFIYLRARYYNSETGRFTTEDPAKDGVNWFVYCSGNPLNFKDSTGYWEESDSNYPWYIQQAILKYTDDWYEANKNGDVAGMRTAHDKANIARSVGNSLVSRDSWGAQDFYDDWVPDTYKHAIVIHHTANNKGVKQIEKEHIEQGYSGIGYHFIISKDGLIYIGRPLEVKGGHVEGFNSGRIGITLIGNFENEIPTAEQLTSMRNLTNVLKDLYGISNSSIVGHRDFNGQMATTITVCPGKNLYQYIRQYWPLWIGV